MAQWYAGSLKKPHDIDEENKNARTIGELISGGNIVPKPSIVSLGLPRVELTCLLLLPSLL